MQTMRIVNIPKRDRYNGNIQVFIESKNDAVFAKRHVVYYGTYAEIIPDVFDFFDKDDKLLFTARPENVTFYVLSDEVGDEKLNLRKELGELLNKYNDFGMSPKVMLEVLQEKVEFCKFCIDGLKYTPDG